MECRSWARQGPSQSAVVVALCARRTLDRPFPPKRFSAPYLQNAGPIHPSRAHSPPETQRYHEKEGMGRRETHGETEPSLNGSLA